MSDTTTKAAAPPPANDTAPASAAPLAGAPVPNAADAPLSNNSTPANSDAIATDEELQAALAEADESSLPSLGGDDEEDDAEADIPAVPVVVRQVQDAPPSVAGAASTPLSETAATGKKLSFKVGTKPAADANSPSHPRPPAPKAAAAGGAKAAVGAKPAPPPVPVLSVADAAKQAAAVGASLTGLGGVVYRTTDKALAAVHLPFGWITPRPRIVLGGLALGTAVVSLLSGWLLPSLYAKVDLTTHTHQRRVAADAAFAARIAAQTAAQAAASASGAGKSHGAGDTHGAGGSNGAKPKGPNPSAGHGH